MQVVAPPVRSSTPTNIVYPTPAPAAEYTPVPQYSSAPVLPAAAVTTVARDTIVSETVAPVEAVGEPESDTPGKVGAPSWHFLVWPRLQILLNTIFAGSVDTAYQCEAKFACIMSLRAVHAVQDAHAFRTHHFLFCSYLCSHGILPAETIYSPNAFLIATLLSIPTSTKRSLQLIKSCMRIFGTY